MRHNLIVSRNTEMITFLRERYLGETWDVTDDPTRAIEVLTKEPVDRLFLDHWLGKEPANGRDVSVFLGRHPEINPRVEVFCASEDGKKARQQQAECKRVAHVIPFDVIRQLGT